jgi:hypothetical protein
MSKKLIYLISFVLVLGSVSNAEDIQWTDLGADHLWRTPENWDLGRVPTLADEVRIDVPAAAAPNGPVIQDGIDAKAKGILTEAPGEPTLTMTGGILEVAEWIWYGDGADSFGIWDMSGGTVTVANEFELGWDGGAGTLTMTGGTINAGEAVIPTGSGAFGELYLHGGTYNVTKADGLSVKENGLIDITEGTLVLEGDDMAKINDLIAAGLITAYGGNGKFELDFDGRNPGKTMLTAIPEPELANPVHQYTFEDGTANDSVGSAHGTLVGDATVAGGALVLDGDGDWMEMPGEVIAMNTYSEVTVETWFTSVAGGNTGFHMLAAFGEEGTGANPGFGYKYLFITPARGDDVSRAAIQTSSMDDSPWDEETGVSANVEHDDGIEHHFVATVDATNITFYIDGELVGSEPLAAGNEIAGIGQAVAYLGRGVYTVDPLWTGSINELNIYDRALSLAQVEANYAAGPVKPAPVHQYTFEDGIANDSIGSAHGTLIGDAAVVGGALVLDGDGDWMSMPGEVIAMNTYSEVTVETWFTSVAGGNTGFHMLAAFGEEGTGANTGFGYKYLFITPARGDDVSRTAIQTSSMDDSPWDEETGVSATVEHDDGIEHHFVATVDSTNITFYIDGELIGSELLAAGNEIAGIGQAVAYLGKGVYPVDPLWTGSINELNIYDRALSLANVQANYAAGPVKPLVHQYTFEDGTANDSVGSAHGTLVGDATVAGGALVLDGDGDWMSMPGEVIAMNTYSEVSVETWFTSVDGGNTGFHMLTAFGEEGTGANPGFGYKYLFITPARGDDVSRTAIQTSSMDDSPWDEETGVSATVEHDDGLEHHFVATVDATNITFYIDGALIGSEPLAAGNEIAGIGQAVAYLGKGVYTVDPLWTGSVEELSIYNRALSLVEVQANYAAGPQKVGPAPVDPGTEGLMLHLPLDTASRGVTQDSSDNDLDGTLFGDPTFVEGVDIMALNFDGVDDYVDTDYTEDLAVWTIACWAKSPAAPSGDPSSASGPVHREQNYQFNWNHQSDDYRGSVTVSAGGWHAASLGTLEADTWYHLAGTYDGEELKAYKDGVLITTNDAPSGPPAAESNSLKLAKHAAAEQYFTGTVDEVLIYNRALSAEEVLFLAGK